MPQLETFGQLKLALRIFLQAIRVNAALLMVKRCEPSSERPYSRSNGTVWAVRGNRATPSVWEQ